MPAKSHGRPIKPLSKRERKAAANNATYIRNDGDEPMDLLSRSIAGGVSSMFALTIGAESWLTRSTKALTHLHLRESASLGKKLLTSRPTNQLDE